MHFRDPTSSDGKSHLRKRVALAPRSARGTRGRTSSLGKMIARGVRRGDYASRQRRGRAGNWKPRYSLNRERPRVFRVIRRPIAPPFPTAFTRGMPFHVCTDDAHTAYWLLLNVVSRHARFDALSLSLSLFSIELERTAFLSRIVRNNRIFQNPSKNSPPLVKSSRTISLIPPLPQRYAIAVAAGNKFPELAAATSTVVASSQTRFRFRASIIALLC